MDEMNDASGDLWIDLMIDDVLTRRTAGRVAEPTRARPGSVEALIVELAELSGIDWPADEVGDRIASGVAAAAGQGAARVPGPAVSGRAAPRPAVAAQRERHQPTGSLRPGRSPWLALAAAAAAVALVAGAVNLIGASGSAAGHLQIAGHKIVPGTSPAGPAGGGTPASLTAMRIVGKAGTLTSIGAVGNGSAAPTCVTRTVCYLEGRLSDGSVDVARSADGGATWTSGAPLPAITSEWNAGLSCPTPLTCFSAFGPALLETTDGFAHVRTAPVTPSGQVEWVSCATTQHCVANVYGGAKGETFTYSYDGGRTWTAASSPVIPAAERVVQLRCDPGGACLAPLVGGTASNATVAALSSTDGGKSWAGSATYPAGPEQQWLVSCGSGRSCAVGFDNGRLAWVSNAPSGRTTIRVDAFPKNWPAFGVALSCATGTDCFLETSDISGSAHSNTTIEVTHDGGLTWSSRGPPIALKAPHDVATSLSCPVAAGCVAIASDGSPQLTWVVLSNLRNGD